MGAEQSRGSAQLNDLDRERIFSSIPAGMLMLNSDYYSNDALASHAAVTASDVARADAAFADGAQLPGERDRAVGCLVGLAVADALGAPLEFLPVRYPGDARSVGDTTPDAGFEHDILWEDKSELRECNRFMLSKGQWTDDTAMALCVADSLLAHDGAFHPRDLRRRFALWLGLGYNNAFGRDEARREHWGPLHSIGCGGIVGEAHEEFKAKPCDYTHKGTLRSSGNGTIMRLAPVPILCRHDVDAAMELAWCQSKTTHQGDEAADCARLLAFLCATAISTGAGKAALDALASFPAKLYATQCLAHAMQEERHAENEGLDLSGRDWRWRGAEYRYHAARIAADPGYAGSYAMDGLAMALHCVHATDTFEAAVRKAANLRGDADTVAAIAGQIAGAMYGWSAIPDGWTSAIGQWEQPCGGAIRTRALLLCELMPPRAADVRAHERPDDESWAAYEQRLADAVAPSRAEAEAAPTAMPYQCACGRGFASSTLFKMHQRKCAVPPAAPAVPAKLEP